MNNNNLQKCKVVITRTLERFEPTLQSNYTDLECLRPISSKNLYGIKKEDKYFNSRYAHYPFIVNPDGSLWVLANRYLLGKLSDAFPANHRTLLSIANALKHFREWVLEENIDWQKFPKRNGSKPTYKYCWYLHDEVKLGKIATSTAKKRMSAVQGFYRWAIGDGYQFDHSLWRENDLTIRFKDSKGFQRNKALITTDLTSSFKLTKTGDDYSEYIDDGGKLRPLPMKEQRALTVALKRVDNTEMTLSFLLALTTGARLQTVFTLRQCNFSSKPREGAISVRIKIGRNTLVNTKFGKQMVLLIPVWLYQKLRIYLKSERYMFRKIKSKHIFQSEEEQYVFLSRNGRPYYASSDDPFASLYRSPPRGNAINKFIRQQILPELEKNGYPFYFRFHDLRATYGMNLLEEKIIDRDQHDTQLENRPSYFKKLLYVRQRMGHNSLNTTQRYLNFRENYNIAMHVQSRFEEHLKTLLDGSGDQYELD